MKIKLPFFRIIGIAFNVLGLSNISHAGCCSGGPPANDNFSGAITLTVGAGAVAGNTCGATIEASENLDCNNGAGQSVWYKFTATGTTSYVIVDYTGGACYGGSAVWAVSSLPTGSCPHALSCQYDWYGPDLTKYQLSTVVGTTYYIQVIFWPGGGCGSGWCFNVNVQNSNPGGTITNPGPGLGQNVGTCSSPIAGCYLQQYAPSVATVTSSCPSYAVTLGVNMVWTSCYDFTTNNSEGSVDIQNIVQSNCGPGNVIWANWTLYSATGCNQISCGDLNNVTVGGLTCNTTYVICFTFEVPNCTHTIEYPYLAWSSPAPPACVPPSVTVTITPTNLLCNGVCTGSATANPSGGTLPYNYNWSNGMTTATINNLCAGSYTITVTDNLGVMGTATVNITQPTPLSASSINTNLNCFNVCIGSINLTASGGISPYTYDWGDIAGTNNVEDRNSLCANTYNVTVTDANGCTTPYSVNITQPSDLSLSRIVTNETCDGACNGSIDLTVSGGTGLYTYSWSGGQVTQDISGLCDATYTVTVTDANGCTKTINGTVSQGTVVTSTFTYNGNQCLSGNSFNFTNTGTSGGGVTYSWIFPSGTPATSNVNNPSGVTWSSAGTYAITHTVTNLGCPSTTIINITVFSQPSLSTIVTNLNCFSVCTGAINLTVAGGTAPFNYDWADVAGASNSEDRNSLCAGSYTITVTDANGCTAATTVAVTQPAAPLSATTTQTDVACNGGSTGQATVNPVDGTPGYTYLWNDPAPAQSTQTVTGLTAGTWTVTVTDNKGCTITQSVTITQPALPISISTSQTDVACNGGNTGQATANPSGGTAGYNYVWNDPAPAQSTQTVTGLTAGTWTVTVTDSKGCTAAQSVVITQPALPLTISITKTDVACNGGNTGQATANPAGGTAGYNYVWNDPAPAQSTQTVTGLTAGTWTVTVTDSKGCTATQSVNITQPAGPLNLTMSGTNISCNGLCNGTATATVGGGSIPYTYSWNDPGFQTTSAATGLCAGTFSVTVTDNKGCTITGSRNLTQPAAIVLSTGSVNATCGGSDGQASVSVTSGGTPSFSFLWNDPAPAQTTAAATGLSAGNYGVTITDANSCTATANVTVNDNGSPTATISSSTNVSCNGGNNGSTAVTAGGGTPGYTYNWSTGGTTSSVAGLIAGNYTVTVSDAAGCNATANVTITQPAVLNASVTSATNVSCSGGNNGTATVSVSGGTISYTYNWSAGGQTTSIATGLNANTFTVTVTDSKGCSATASATITQPGPLSTANAVTDNNCNGGNTGSITTTPAGGTAPFGYTWTGGQTNATATGLIAGTYTVTVTDSKGCTATASSTVTQPSGLTLNTSSVNSTCGSANGTATATAGGGTSPYLYNWSPSAQTTSTATGLIANAYNITVTDSKGCTITGSVAVINTPGGTAAANVVSNATAAGVCNGTANVTMAGGTSPFNYNWSSGSTASSAVGLCAGNYCVTVTDVNTCTSVSCITITEPPPITLTIVPVNVLCAGNCTGSANLTVSGGTPSYTYLWSNALNAEDLTNLCAGTFTVTVTDASGATASNSVTITEPAAVLSATASVVNVTCNGLCNGSASITPAGGTLSYTYAWSGGGTSSTKNSLCAGNFTVTVTDNNGCTAIVNGIVTQPSVLTASSSVTDASCNGSCNGSATVTPAGGTSPYTYAWNGGGTSSTKSGLCAGNHTVTVTDNKGCTVTANIVVNQPAVLTATSSVNNVTCNGLCNGSATVTPSGGTSPYNYLWSGGGTASVKSGLCAGNHTVTVTDNKGCTVTALTNVTQPVVLTVTATGGTATCFGSCNGTATASPAGGTIPYLYVWSNGGQTGATATGYCAGNYTVTVTDSKSCTATANVTVNQPLAVTVSVTTVNSNCSQSNGSATANAGNGVIPYTYLWDVSAGSQTTSTATGLMSGNYNVTVTDANGCSATATASVADNTGPVVTILSSSDISCFGGFTGTATVLVTDGQPPYTYLWSPSGQTTSNATGLPAGNHSVLVTDVNGCNSSVNVSLTQPTVLSVSITSNNITCNGLCNGSATASGSGGVLPYAYSWSNGSTNSSVTGLCTGTFTVTITDNNGCSATANTNITQPVILSVSVSGTNVTCNGSCNGNANANPSGGTSPYTYLWSNGSTGTITTGLCAGAYTVTISDSKGCSVTGTVNVTQPSALSASISSQNDVTCNGQCNGFAQVSVSQGTSPYSYSWSNGQTNPLATGLCTGTFTVTATDANSCTATTQVIITQPAAISISLSATNVSCYGNSDGSTSVTASGGTAPYQYQWNDLNLQTTSSATGLDAGTFNLSVTDSKGCSVTGSISVTEPLEITLSFSTNGSNCNQADGSATVTVSSGSNPPFSYLWSANAASQTTNTASSLSAGSYTVTVTDAVGCTSAGTVTVSDLGSPSLSILSQGDASCNGSCDGFASVLVTGGTPPYSYTWNSIPAQTTATATGLCAGNYICNVVDPNNCNANIGVAIGQPSLLNLTIVSPSNASCFGLCDGQSTALASGGTSPYSYLWNDPFSQATQTATGLCPGNYSVAAVDDNGCTSDKPVTISQPAIISLTINPVDAHCGQPDGSALASASGGNGSYGYSWNNGQNNPNAVSLTAGSYTVTVTDIKGCTTTGSATVNNIPAGTAVITVTNPVSCYGNSNGSLAVSVAGATPPLSYLWSNGGIQSAVTGLSSGVFYVSATDFFGCLSTDSFNLTQPAQISILTGDGSEDCFGDCSGKVTATPSGGVSPFSYLWDDPLASQNIYAENLCAGTYNVTVTDNNGCAQTASASVTSPTPVSLSESHTDATCGAANGTGTVTASGGVTPYSYQWPAGQTTSAVNNLFAGTYLITVTDNTGCSSTILVPVSNPSGLNVIVLSSDSVNCNGGNDGSVVISVSGGTMPYTYQWNDPLNQTAPNAANLPAGTWIVTVTDATACQTGAPVTIFEPAPLGFSLTAVNPQCDGDCNGSASVTVSGGTPPYSYLWDDPQSQTISSPAGLCSGTVNLIITDANGCNELSVITLFDPLPMSVVTTVTSTICGPGCSGTASAFTTNGVSPFTYQWNDPANQLTQTAVNLCSGTYLVTVTDDDGCSFISSATVSQPATVTVSMASIGNNACYGNCSGWAQADATGGSPPYIYLWSNGQNLSQAINLCSGTYTVTVTDSSGCQDITGVTITQPLLLGGSITSNDISCYGACDGNAAVNISGGTSPYSYLWDDPSFQTTSSATGLCSGIFTLTVTDTNGCQQIFSVQITEPSPLTFTSSAIPSSCGNNNGQACLSVSGGEFPYVITWNDPYTQVGSCAFNLQAGAYIATIGDANGCVVSGPVTVNDISGVNIDSVIFNDVTCNGDSDGWAIVYVTGIAPPFTYLWKRGAVTVGTGSNITGLSGGNYTITVWDTNNCSNSSAIPVFEPTPPGAAVISKTNANCSGSCDGTAQAMAGGGITPYTFMWDGVQTTSNATGLCAGSHILEVTDGNGCQVILNAVITEPDPVLVSPTVTPITCSGTCNGMISLLPGPTGGTPYYLYQWTPLVGYGPSVSNLCPNQYIVVVTDVKGCTGGDTVLITDPLPLIADSITNPSTCGGDNGSAAVIASGGTVPYTYLWPDGQTNAIVTNLEARDPYWVTITDAVGCVTVIPVTVDDIPGPDNITVTATNLLCYNDNSGIAVAVVSGGTLPYTHSWPSGPDNDTITGLPAGVFIVTVSDANGCTITGGVSVTQPNLVFAMNVQPDTICFGQTGSVYASFNGGSPPYTYYWYDDGFPSTQGPHQVNPVSATDYEVYVEDANGCLSDTQVVSIAVRPQLTVSASSAGNICIGSSTVVTAFVSGGNNGPYSYLWSNNSPNQSITVSPSVSTTYTVTVTDGCSQPETASATVNINPYPAPAFTLSNLGGCTPFSVQVFDGSTISAGSIVSWYWQVSDGQTSTDQNPVFLFTNSGVNTVTLTVTSNMGCASSYTGINQITIYQSPAAYFTPVPGETTILWANIKFIDGSSAGVTSWSWDFGDTASGDLNYDTVENPVHTYDAIGNYIITLTVESSDGCVGAYADEVIVKEDYVLFAPNAFTPDGDGRNDYFLPEGLGIDPNNFTLYIYSRWGDLIYRTSDLNKPWDGKANNGTGLVQQDVYVWIITTSDPDGNNHKYVGHVTLVK